MIYANQTQAERAAAELNARYGQPRARAIHSIHGWTVISSYAFGLSR